MKIALVSTPRSGNTWLRLMVAGAYGLDQLAVHDPFSIDWPALPERSIVQVHWPLDERFAATVESAGFRIMTIARHPLDVLISILHFCGREPQTRQWLLGEAGDEDSIAYKAPTDPCFARYASGARAAALLRVSAQWWRRQPPVQKVRYEALLADPAPALKALEAEWGAPLHDVARVVAEHSLEKLVPTSGNCHYWQGRAGIWQQLIEPALARDIAAAHPDVFAALGYSADTDAAVDPLELRQNWFKMA